VRASSKRKAFSFKTRSPIPFHQLGRETQTEQHHRGANRTKLSRDLKTFSRKCGANDHHVAEQLNDNLAFAEKDPMPLDLARVENGFDTFRRWRRLDARGLCVAARLIVSLACSVEFTVWLARCLARRKVMESLVACARVWGKASCRPETAAIRAIVPLSALLCITDRALGALFEVQLQTLRPKIPGVYFGVLPKTQALGIAHGISTLMEVGPDNRSQVAVAQMDITSYFDALLIF
jgi:hypothetical protein